jgi:hypothetical protein
MNKIHTLQTYYPNILFNIIFTSTPRSSNRSLPFKFSKLKCYTNFSHPLCVLHAPPISSSFILSSQYLAQNTNYKSPAGAKVSLLASASRPALGPTQPPVQWVPAVLSSGVMRGRGVTLTTHPHLVPRSRTNRATPPPPLTPPWRVAGQFYFYKL